MKTIAQNIIALRKEKKWTQGDLAAHSRISRSTIACWETGRNIPKIDMIARLADTFKVSVQNIDERLSVGTIKSDCEHLCEQLNAFEKDALKKYCSIPEVQRTGIYKQWDKDIDETLKKSLGHRDAKTA